MFLKVSFLEISGVFAPFTNEVKSILAHFFEQLFSSSFRCIYKK